MTTSLMVSLCLTSVAWAGISREEKSELKSTNQAYQETSAEEALAGFSLDEAVRFGMLRNAALRSAYYKWKASVHDIDQAVSLEDPQIGFKTFIDEVETRVGAQKEMYSVSQMLPFPGKLSTKGAVATAMSRQKHAEYQKAKLQYLYELKDAYFEYWYLRKNILVTEKNMELLKHFEGVAQSKFKSSQSSNQDLLKAQVELGILQNEILTLNDYRNPVIARLNAVLNRDIGSLLAWPEELDHQVIDLDKEYVFERFLENNPDLKKSNQRIIEAKKKVWLARLDYLPDFMIGYDYIRVDQRPIALIDNGKDASAATIKINMPLWFGKQQSQLDEAKSLESVSDSEKIQLEKNLSAKIETVIFKLKDSARQIRLYRDALIPKAEQSLKASETAYSAGNIDFLNLIDSERTLLKFQLAYYRSIRDYEKRLSELEMIVGEPLRGEGYGK
ncbi:MAG: cobalt-zinc-cadmium efflux system outer membrane protein [Candidatus Omnitrophota bacterium]|jgi:cobalt-zinc-cadmium efflux system outer membrane protein